MERRCCSGDVWFLSYFAGIVEQRCFSGSIWFLSYFVGMWWGAVAGECLLSYFVGLWSGTIILEIFGFCLILLHPALACCVYG